MKKIFRLSIVLFIYSLSKVFPQEFSPGPYGANYYDTAGPFQVIDLNAQVLGDINYDESIDVEDAIWSNMTYIGDINLTDDQFNMADVNQDSVIDELDVVGTVNRIQFTEFGFWDFEQEWNGEESYIFIHYSPSVNYSTALWLSNEREVLLNNSPMNVHYFFVSSRESAMEDVLSIKEFYDEILNNMSADLQTHWKKHLHFVPTPTDSLNNWLTEALNGKYALGIDRFQKLKQIGYLGNPNGFTGTYVNYLAHEAHYYNYVWDAMTEEEDYFELTIFDSTLYSGGWSPTTSTLIELPDSELLSTFTRMEVEARLPCNGYLDSNCDDYDRIAHFYVCQGQCYETIYYDLNEEQCLESGYSWDSDGELCYSIEYLENVSQDECPEDNWNYNRNCQEIARWITPFDRQPSSVTDITPYMAMLASGGTKMFKFMIGGWPNRILTIKLRLFEDGNQNGVRQEFIPMWTGGGFYSGGEPVYNDNHEPIIFSIPEDAVKVEFSTYITGHGWGSDTGNCAEFCNTRHFFSVNGGVFDFDKSHPTAGGSATCMQLEEIAGGVIPNQWGTWGYGRQGWCPGLDVEPYVMDITDYLIPGEENVMEYEICWANSGNQCYDYWPTITDPGGYLANISMTSFIIISK